MGAGLTAAVALQDSGPLRREEAVKMVIEKMFFRSDLKSFRYCPRRGVRRGVLWVCFDSRPW